MFSTLINQSVRLLSITWMFGVIAAQIQGGAPFLSIVFGLPLITSQLVLAVGIALIAYAIGMVDLRVGLADQRTTKVKRSRLPNWVYVGFMLAMTHYGVGFVLGTAESTFELGASGSAYAIACGLGLMALSLFASYYFNKSRFVWDLLASHRSESGSENEPLTQEHFIEADTERKSRKQPIGYLSKLWYSVTQEWPVLSILASMSILIGMLAWLGGPFWYVEVIRRFPDSILKLAEENILLLLSFFVPTVLLTMIGVDFQQFLIRGEAESQSCAVKGCILGGVILIALSFLPASVIIAALDIGQIEGVASGNEAFPAAVQNLPGVSHLVTIALMVTLLGSGANVTRAMIKTYDIGSLLARHFRINRQRWWLGTNSLFVISVGMYCLIALVISFLGPSIIAILTSFYAIYVGGVFIPMAAVLLFERCRSLPSQLSIIASVVLGTAGSFLTFIAILATDRWGADIPFKMILVGLPLSVLGLLIGEAHRKFKIMSEKI